MRKARNVPVETVIVGDVISVVKPYKDTRMTLEGTVARVLAEGRVRQLYTSDGVELARYVIGRSSDCVVTLVKAAAEPHSMLDIAV